MNVIFLAAGLGRRMGAEEKGTPKVLFRLGDGPTILESNLANLATVADRVSRVILVTGYRGQMIEEVASAFDDRLEIVLAPNRDYASTGPARSGVVGLEHAPTHQGIAIANGDTLFSAQLLARALAPENTHAQLVCSRDKEPEADDVRVRLTANDQVAEAGKRIPEADTHGVSAGFLAAAGAGPERHLRTGLETIARRERDLGRNLHWHSVVAECHQAGMPIEAQWVSHDEWQEFDGPDDIRRYVRAREQSPTQGRQS